MSPRAPPANEYGGFSVISRMFFLILIVMEVSDRGLLVLFSFALECLSEMEWNAVPKKKSVTSVFIKVASNKKINTV